MLEGECWAIWEIWQQPITHGEDSYHFHKFFLLQWNSNLSPIWSLVLALCMLDQPHPTPSPPPHPNTDRCKYFLMICIT